ncbi:hypothetical protein SAMN04488698_10116 [Candidatus Frackibacter sp. WG12]|uniref:hypothetical protein n=1 Tax=Candidatus Frackibacter sp. WG12 TaxID=2017977 RepID=UPI0008B2C466|nr:hypothetical protein [Candidatus Frackibacter sp. WG12]SEM27792.1 hypothetical protein SAMN04488698_10116 [Candidatus Frackibacter sp. WG12]
MSDDQFKDESIMPSMTSDFNLLAQSLYSLTNSYRLFVGAAEELTRTPSVSEETINAAIARSSRLGNILDILLLLQLISIMDNLGDN